MSGVDRKTLMVIGNIQDQEFIRDLLDSNQKLHYSIWETTLGYKGLELIQTIQPDLIILNPVLSDMKVNKFIEIFSDGSGLPVIPVLILTSNAEDSEVGTAMKSGAADYILKHDLNPAVLDWIIKHTIEKHWYRKESGVSSSKRIEEAIKDNEERFRLLADNSLDLIFKNSYDGTILYVSPSCFTILGYTSEELIGNSAFDLFYDHEDLAVVSKSIMEIINEKKDKISITYRCRRKDGSFVWMETHSTAVFDKNSGLPLYTTGVARDITEHKQAEDALRESEDRYRSVVDALQEGVILHDVDGVILTANDSAIRILGQPGDSLEGISLEDQRWNTIHEDGSPFPLDKYPVFETLLSGKPCSGIVMGLIQPDNSVRWVSINTQPLYRSDNSSLRGVVSSFIDISEQKNALKALINSENRFGLVAENSSDVIWTMDIDGRFTYVSPSILKLIGYTPTELLSMTIEDVLTPSSIKIASEKFQNARQAGAQGKRLPDLFRLEHPCKDGSTIWTESSTDLMYDTSGKVQGILGITRNITERLKLEEMLLEQEKLKLDLQKEQEMSVLKSKMMNRISHEFRTPLTVIMTSTELFDSYFDRMTIEKRRKIIGGIQSAIQRITSMLDDISIIVRDELKLTRQYFSEVDLEALCRQIISQQQDYDTSSHNFIFNIGEDLIHFIADERLLSYVIRHLISNAVKYSPEHSNIWIDLHPEGDKVVLKIKDEGIGIPESDLPHIFDTFYRGSNIDEVSGIGIGLSIVKNAITQHHGSVRVESGLNEGTTFIIRLPLQA